MTKSYIIYSGKRKWDNMTDSKQIENNVEQTPSINQSSQEHIDTTFETLVSSDSQNTETIVTPSEETEQETPKRRINRRAIGITLTAITAAGAGLAAFGITSSNNDSKNTPQDSDSNDRQTSETQAPAIAPTPEATPVASPTPEVTPEPAVQLGSLEIPATLSPEEMGKAFIENDWNSWRMAGITDSLYNEAMSSDASPDEFSLNLAHTESQKFADEIFIDGWQDHEDLVTFENYMEGQSDHVIRYYIATATESEPYKWYSTVDSVNAQGDVNSQVRLSITFTQHNNATANNVATLYPEAVELDGTQTEIDVTLQNVDGIMKVSIINQHDAVDYSQ